MTMQSFPERNQVGARCGLVILSALTTIATPYKLANDGRIVFMAKLDSKSAM